jgi:hypothetical protein
MGIHPVDDVLVHSGLDDDHIYSNYVVMATPNNTYNCVVKPLCGPSYYSSKINKKLEFFFGSIGT